MIFQKKINYNPELEEITKNFKEIVHKEWFDQTMKIYDKQIENKIIDYIESKENVHKI